MRTTILAAFAMSLFVGSTLAIAEEADFHVTGSDYAAMKAERHAAQAQEQEADFHVSGSEYATMREERQFVQSKNFKSKSKNVSMK